MPSDPVRLGLALACAVPLVAAADPVASAPHAGASAACAVRGASAPGDAVHASSKLRHVPDEDDPCADSRGLGQRFEPLHPIGARPAAAAASNVLSPRDELGKQKP